jgi:Zn-dependent protease
MIVIILLHELGHVALLQRYSIPVGHIVLHGFGGEYETNGEMTPWQSAVVAWGGVLAQFALFVIANACATSGIFPLRLTRLKFEWLGWRLARLRRTNTSGQKKRSDLQ